MYCGKCGNQVNDNAKFCPKCGAEIKNNSGVQIQQTYNTTVMAKKEISVNKNVIRGIMIAILAVIVFVIIRVIGGSGSAEKTAIKACKAELNGDLKAYYGLLAPDYQEYMTGEDGWFTKEEFLNQIESNREDRLNKMKGTCGDDIMFTYEVTEVTKCENEEQLNKVKKELKGYYDYDIDKVKDAEKICITINGSGTEGKGVWMTYISCVKIRNKWYVHRPGIESLQ